jgi:predicted RNA-binding protein
MNWWIFTVAPRKIGDQQCDPCTILKQRVKDEFWGLPRRAGNRLRLEQGDQVVFYVAGNRHMEFAARATLAGKSVQLFKEEQEKYGHNNPCHHSEYGVRLENIQWLDIPQKVRPLIRHLDFIENKQNWGLSFRHSIIKLGKDDFEKIVK